MMPTLIQMAETGWLPERLIRVGIRRLLQRRLDEIDLGSPQQNQQRLQELVESFSNSPLAVVPEKANEQHYEVPAELFRLTLGPHLKYSSCYWNPGTRSLAQAEADALRLTCEHAELEDGMSILELGCGWGSLSLWMAEHFPQAKITSVSNSGSQRQFIEARARERGLQNLEIVTCDINEFDSDSKFDRVVSVEMFEHVRNHRKLFRLISGWLKPEGKLFCHIFCHREFTYLFEDRTANDWMSRYFFSGGMMPGKDLFRQYDEHLQVEQQWIWSGEHYQKTCEAWLDQMAANRPQVMEVLCATYGSDARRWYHRWRMFYLACSELFGFHGGNEWWVSHYLFQNVAGQLSPRLPLEQQLARS